MNDYHKLIEQILGQKQTVIKPLHGGDINVVYQAVNAAGEQVVVKMNDAGLYPQLLAKEAEGLALLDELSGLAVPAVLGTGEIENIQFLVLAFIETGTTTDHFWTNFGSQLAIQHKRSADRFGLETDNYIGTLKQSNTRHLLWADFLIQERLLPQIKWAVDKGIINGVEARQIESFFQYIDEIWPNELPALLHGDLWSGNFIAGLHNTPYLIDPAVYYGHREIDLGMMHLFGSPWTNDLFDQYNEVFPLEKNWKKRLDFNQLYPLLVHLNLFGRSYFEKIRQIIRPFY